MTPDAFSPGPRPFLSDAWLEMFATLAMVQIERSRRAGAKPCTLTFEELFTDVAPEVHRGYRFTIEEGELTEVTVIDRLGAATCSMVVDAAGAEALAQLEHADPAYVGLRTDLEARGGVRVTGDLGAFGELGTLLDGLHDTVARRTGPRDGSIAQLGTVAAGSRRSAT